MEFATESAIVEEHLVPQVLDVSEERDEVNKAAVVYVKQLFPCPSESVWNWYPPLWGWRCNGRARSLSENSKLQQVWGFQRDPGTAGFWLWSDFKLQWIFFQQHDEKKIMIILTSSQPQNQISYVIFDFGKFGHVVVLSIQGARWVRRGHQKPGFPNRKEVRTIEISWHPMKSIDIYQKSIEICGNLVSSSWS